MVSALCLTGFAALSASAGNASDGYTCTNGCPLAQQANTHRASGSESQATSPVIRAALAAQVEANCQKI
jgi:hypothetical protein